MLLKSHNAYWTTDSIWKAYIPGRENIFIHDNISENQWQQKNFFL